MQKPEELVEKITKEEQELDIKLSDLECFMMSADFIKVSPEQKTLLEQQHKVMTEYKLILIKRAHRINWEAGRDKAAAEIKEANAEQREPEPQELIDPERCKTCANAPVHWSTCHDCVRGSNWKDGLHWEDQKDCKDCANSIDGKVCTGDKEHGWVDTTGEKKCFEPKKYSADPNDHEHGCANCKHSEFVPGDNYSKPHCTNPKADGKTCWEAD